MAMGAGDGRTTIGALANSPHCVHVHSPQLRMHTSYADPTANDHICSPLVLLSPQAAVDQDASRVFYKN